MKVTVTLIPSKHPEYLTEIISLSSLSDSPEIIYQFQARFAAYRDFAAFCEKISPQLMTGIPFPPTYTASAYGFKLTDTQLMERKNLLEQVSWNSQPKDLIGNLFLVVESFRK
jgi:hypothetical protein